MKGSSNNSDTQPQTKQCGKFTVTTIPISTQSAIYEKQIYNLPERFARNTDKVEGATQKGRFWVSKIEAEENDLKQKPLSR